MPTVLLVEDDDVLARLIDDFLTNNGFQVARCGRASHVLAVAAHLAPDLIILDIGLPDGDGYSVCRQLRETHTMPVLMLTARADELDEVMGLECGADDYMAKPVRPQLLLARLRALLRRQGPPPKTTTANDAKADAVCVGAL